ncbi:polysaccharide deacetylase family protein [Phenylobacterium sp.]|uniref:polysaccharide deacetylase family protein n=1 Tax=Phenylobacterium sp. TaxID=1871053 RepID=UPI0027348DDE|nr:polysaccharide deacetylase family protein [Phenylobacterium sp.]MDP3853069.1 polysaccharide deacetylase family protein [Phenylobacterium sp.]
MTASLVERLGYEPDARLLIVNCDDLGSSASANRATEQALAGGLATSATLMVPCPWALDGVRRGEAGGIGVHLTLTCEYPGYRWRSLTGAACLHDAEGYMPTTAQAVWEKADLDAVRAECRAQIDQAYAWGVDVTHLDAHMGTMQLEPGYGALFLELAAAYDLPVRMIGASVEQRLGLSSRAQADELGLVFPDKLVTTWAKPAKPTFEAILEDLPPGVTEVYLHPVEDGPELRAYDPNAPQIRVDDRECLLDPAFKARAAELGIVLIDFLPLRELQRARG